MKQGIKISTVMDSGSNVSVGTKIGIFISSYDKSKLFEVLPETRVRFFHNGLIIYRIAKFPEYCRSHGHGDAVVVVGLDG